MLLKAIFVAQKQSYTDFFIHSALESDSDPCPWIYEKSDKLKKYGR